MKRKFQILNEFKAPLPLMAAEKIIFTFQGENGPIEKSNVEIIDHAKGIVAVELSDFEVQGLSLGSGQNCGCKVLMQNADEYTVLFSSAINVQIKDGRKVWL